MSLTRQLEPEEWDILAIFTDPILLGEYLRNTADGSPLKEEWPKIPFKYRWYQKDLLTDKTPFICLTAGRAVGKCSPDNARIYTYPYGYVTIKTLWQKLKKKEEKSFIVYALDTDTKELVQKRARLSVNGTRVVYEVITNAGHRFLGTGNHPLLTERGWIMINDINEDDKVAIATYLPHDSEQNSFSWEELRWFGYSAGLEAVTPQVAYNLKFQANVVEFERIAEYFDATLMRNRDGTYYLRRKTGPIKHYVSRLMEDLRLGHLRMEGLYRIPEQIKAERLENIKIMLEGLFSAHAVFTTNEIRIPVIYKKSLILDIQELLLRFGVESRIEWLEGTKGSLIIDDYYAYYTFFSIFEVPGVQVRNLKLPTIPVRPTPFMRFDKIKSISPLSMRPTYAITVNDHANYISDNLFVHNSLVLEDKIICDAVNVEEAFPMTKESLLTTANVNQMTPILDRLTMRLGNSYLLKDFLQGNINRSKGTLDFPQPGGSNYRINARIAGSKGENNMINNLVPC